MNILTATVATIVLATACSSGKLQVATAGHRQPSDTSTAAVTANAATLSARPAYQLTDIRSTDRLRPIGRYRGYSLFLYAVEGASVEPFPPYVMTTASPDIRQGAAKIAYRIENNGGPECYAGQEYSIEQLSRQSWHRVPFKDGFGWNDMAYGLPYDGTVSQQMLARRLIAGRYRIRTEVSVRTASSFRLTADSILPEADIPTMPFFECRVLPSRADTIRVLVVNRSPLEVSVYGMPSVLTADEREMTAHPLARSGTPQAFAWMRRNATLPPGKGIALAIPVSWNPRDISNERSRSHFSSGRMAEGHYRVSILIDVNLSCPFTVVAD